MRRLLGFIAWPLLLCAGLFGGTLAAAPAFDSLLGRLEPQGKVNDFAGLLTPAQRDSLQSRADALEKATGVQLAIVTLQSLEGGQIDDFANKLFVKWGVGQRGQNNGVMLLVAMQDRKGRVEVGYGLEPILPDALAGRVLDEQLFPAFKQQRYAEGLTAAVERIAQIVERNEPATATGRRKGEPQPFSAHVFIVLFLSVFVGLGFGGVGAGARSRSCALLLWGLLFGGLPHVMAWGMVTSGEYHAFVPLALIPVALCALVLGWKVGKSVRTGRGWQSSGSGGWTWSSGGFSSGGSSGGFGGGSSGGGGASGSW